MTLFPTSKSEVNELKENLTEIYSLTTDCLPEILWCSIKLLGILSWVKKIWYLIQNCLFK